MAIGLLLILIFRPQGILGSREPAFLTGGGSRISSEGDSIRSIQKRKEVV
jgi:hypothetical protein